jgi:predicted pyridoxine 5'-phosphate oxidase superfamily flavin-nucleotide-binding protein
MARSAPATTNDDERVRAAERDRLRASAGLCGRRPDEGDPMSDEDHVYHNGMRRLQDRFDSRRLADRLEQEFGRSAFTDQDRAFIESRPLFFLASADAAGRPDCSHKGGAPGFVRVIGPAELEFPSYDGNGQFRSLGNIVANPSVGLLFIDFDSPRRLRVNGEATLLDGPADVARHHGAQLVVRVRARHIFPNCPRYIHRHAGAELSPYTPQPGYSPPEPAWKSMQALVDALPKSTRTP